MFDVKLEKLLKWANTTYENEESGLRRHYKEGYRNAVKDITHIYEAYVRGLTSTIQSPEVKQT